MSKVKELEFVFIFGLLSDEKLIVWTFCFLKLPPFVKNKSNKTKIPPSYELQKKITNYLLERDVISFRAGDVISLCPPLSINKDEIDFLVDALENSISKIEEEI